MRRTVGRIWLLLTAPHGHVLLKRVHVSWGSHHLVVGGAVQGQDTYGAYPVVGECRTNDVGAGRLIPTIAVDQYAAILARWFGLSDGQIRQVFPNFPNFGSSACLGFSG